MDKEILESARRVLFLAVHMSKYEIEDKDVEVIRKALGIMERMRDRNE